MIVTLSKPVTYCDRTYTELDIKLDELKGKDIIAVTRSVEAASKRPVLSPNTDLDCLVAMAARAARVDTELLLELPVVDFTRVTTEVQAFLLGAG